MKFTYFVIILLCMVGCQPTSVPVDDNTLPTLIEFPTAASTPLSTRVLRQVATRLIIPTDTLSPTPLVAILTPTQTQTSLSPTAASLSISAVVPQSFIFGQSVSGQNLIAWRLGSGEKTLMLVGGVHGGWESNTVDLMNELITHFSATPDELLPEVSLLVIPVLNPDGVARGRVLEGRFNDHQVDLNRNWGCGWEQVAYFRTSKVSPGTQPFSEPEALALSNLILEERPAAVLFYHSAADGIFAGGCENEDAESDKMAAVLGEATGYSYGADFTSYPVTGTAPAWVTAQGIPSADMELATWRQTEFERNLRGVVALQCWSTGKSVLECN